MKKTSDNYLDYIFEIGENIQSTTDDDGTVTVDMENKGFTALQASLWVRNA